MDYDYRNDPKLPEKWKTRFEFFDRFGAPNTPAFKIEYNTLPTKQKRLINMNWFAFFFGPIYMAIIGLWKQALALLGLIIALNFVIGMVLPDGAADAVSRGLGFAFAFLCAFITNYAHYCRKVKGQSSWNPFQGMRW